MDSNADSFNTLDNQSWGIIERQLLSFETACRQQQSPVILDFLELSQTAANSSANPQLRRQLLAELIKVEIRYQWKQGHERLAEYYFDLYPELDSAPLRKEIIEAELAARSIVDRLPDAAELKQRFGTAAKNWGQFVNGLEERDQLQSKTHCGHIATVVENLDNPPAGKSAAVAGYLQAGDWIDRYLLKEQIGSGSFSHVWRAADTQLRRDVAIKFLRPDKAACDESIVVRLIRESRAAAAIEHPGVVKIHEVSTNEYGTFIVEQFIDGPTLKAAMERGDLSRTHCIEIVRDSAIALHAAHECGVVHRDVKPANILLADGKQPVIVDFGLARHDQFNDGTLTNQGDLIGTPAYMSPQQALGENHLIDARTDVYSLGAVLYHLLTGVLPFTGSAFSMLDAVVNRSPDRRPLNRHAIDRDLETIVLRCLEKEPGDRYSSAAALSDDLQRYLDGQPIQARPVGLAEKTWKWAKRHPRFAGVLAGSVLLFAFLLGTLLQLRSVSAQRSRAEAAEQQSQELLLQSTKNAGRLAMQRGKMQQAVDYFRRASEMCAKSDLAVEIDLAESLIAVREIAEAENCIAEIDVRLLPDNLRGRSQLLLAQLALERGDSREAARLFEGSKRQPLSDAQLAYVRAMLSERSRNVVNELKSSLQLAPLAHHPRRLLVTMLLSLGDFEEAETQNAIAEQLFPDDIDFQLLEGILLAARDQLETALTRLEALPLPELDRERWKEFFNIVNTIRTDYSHRENRFAFHEGTLTSLADDYVEVVGPCLASRGFAFPPKIADRFARLFDSLANFRNGDIDVQAIWPDLQAVVQIHPEGSLINLNLSTLLRQNRIVEAFNRSREIETARGYVPDSLEMFTEIRFTVALVEFSKNTGEIDRSTLLKAGTEAVREFEKYPFLVDKYSGNPTYGRILSTLLIEAFQQGIAEESLVTRWLDRWSDNPESGVSETIWARAVVANRAGRPFDTVDLLMDLQEFEINDNGKLDEYTHKAAADLKQALIRDLSQYLKKAQGLEIDQDFEKSEETDEDSD